MGDKKTKGKEQVRNGRQKAEKSVRNIAPMFISA